MSRYEGYQGNPNLPRESYIHSFTQHELNEFRKCVADPVYFATQYIRIVNVDRGLIPFEMWDFQKNLLQSFNDNRFSICKLPRQVGKTTTAVAFLLHYILFNKDVNIAILANKSSTAREIMGRLQLAFEYLPRFLQQGVKEWNKGNIELANGSKAQADSTSGSSVRGKSFNIIFLDEFAHVPANIAEAFFMSTYPTISSGNTTKVIIVSTPNGLNLFYKMWMDSIEKRSEYVPTEIHWSMVPGRDEVWKEQTIRNTSQEQFEQEFECNFVGSTNTLINASKLRALVFKNPISRDDDLHIYEKAEPGKTYVLVADVAEGQGLDYSTFSVIDVSQIPYRQVAKYKNNKISPFLFPAVIYSAAKRFNEAFILIEINSIGLQVADILHNELAYENLIKVRNAKGRVGQQVTPGFTKQMQFGLKTSVQTKKIGCANLKSLIENDKLIVNDEDTIMELTTFSASKASFAAEEGNNDDLVMTLVNFGWLSAQKYFKESVNSDIRRTLQEEQLSIMDNDIVPFGAISGYQGSAAEESELIDGDLWVTDRSKFTMENMEFETLSNKHRL
ncbi:large terminase protein [uncultured Caudovirales phage]|uniref:Large terminase protein n=1 Tax=uncultured Caudovirales phage TaxID=2100421 RepID=A0A6J5Q9T6_9CAUD|nr:large terminase protein [uncultured Caudovirales phage]CAB4176055.1 large terminase protein [uncultured Caudovirales phage]CAB4181480.1 large terminase protein [uncultured Caudovirales phage]CAB4189575.1 large terminase protein [uncultured Caudovirales phage]CAB4211247.1 large terminase protein [uncultured Caudovirales phage]